MVDPIEILLELGFDLDDISTDEAYLSALKEAIATIEFKTGGAGDERSSALREEVQKVRERRKNKVKDFVSPRGRRTPRTNRTRVEGEVGYTPKAIPTSSIIPKNIEEPESEEDKKKARTKKDMDFMAFLRKVVSPSLTKIEKSLDNIISVMSQEESQKKKTQEKTRVARDKERKQEREEGRENLITKTLGGVKDRVMAPVKSIFDKIVEFFTTIGIGILAIQALKILQDPAGYFGPILNPLIDFLNGTIKFVWSFINPMYGIIQLLNTSIRGLETVVNNTLGKIPGVPELDLPEITGVMEPPQIPRIEKPEEENIPGMSEGGKVTSTTGEKITGMGPDTQMVALEPGEVVMSKKAVDAYGADTLLGMNAAAGGTNRPTMGKVQGFRGGGMVGRDLSQYSNEQLKGMLDPTMMGAKNPAVFKAAQSARKSAKQQGLSKQQTDRLVLEATVRASKSSPRPQHQGGQRSRSRRKPPQQQKPQPQQQMVPGSSGKSEEKKPKNPVYGSEHLKSYAMSQGITDPTELAMFMAQMSHESGSFKYTTEIASGDDYEGSSILGNTQAGDGRRFKGRGYVQLTGRWNYGHYGKLAGVDLVNNPELAADPDVAARVAVAYWKDRVDRNAARAGDIRKVTYDINGGYNGLQDRIQRFDTYMRGETPAGDVKGSTGSGNVQSRKPEQTSLAPMSMEPNPDPSTWMGVSENQNMLQPSDMILDASAPGFGMVSPPQIKPRPMNRSIPGPPSRGGKGGMSVLPIPSSGGSSGPVGSTGGGSAPSGFSPVDQSNTERLVVKAIYNIIG